MFEITKTKITLSINKYFRNAKYVLYLNSKWVPWKYETFYYALQYYIKSRDVIL